VVAVASGQISFERGDNLMKKVLLVAIALILVIGIIPLTACGGGEEEYKIGAVLAITGFNSALGEPEKQTLEMLEEEINDAGGIDGKNVKIIIYDTETDNDIARTATKRLIEQDNVLAVIGASSSGVTMAMLDTITEAEVPLVSLAAADEIVKPVDERYWIFKTPQPNSMVADRIYEYLDSEGITEVAIISASDGYGVLGHDALVNRADYWDMNIVADETFDPDDTDMTTQLTKIKGFEPEAVICWGTNKGSSVVAKNMKSLDMDMPLLMSHGIANKDFIDAAGTAADGVIFPVGKLPVADLISDSDPQKEVLLDYTADFEALWGEGNVDTFGGHAWDAFILITNAIQSLVDEGKEVDRAGIRDKLESAELIGISGVFNMSTTDHLGLTSDCLVLVEIEDGEWTLLEE
jgi:branched-chain amino acid transport system substrate-binding protein